MAFYALNRRESRGRVFIQQLRAALPMRTDSQPVVALTTVYRDEFEDLSLDAFGASARIVCTKGNTMNHVVPLAALSANPFNIRSIGERVEDWHCHGLPERGLNASERAEVIEDAQSSFMAEFVGKGKAELQALEDKELVATLYWAMHEATR